MTRLTGVISSPKPGRILDREGFTGTGGGAENHHTLSRLFLVIVFYRLDKDFIINTMIPFDDCQFAGNSPSFHTLFSHPNISYHRGRLQSGRAASSATTDKSTRNTGDPCRQSCPLSPANPSPSPSAGPPSFGIYSHPRPTWSWCAVRTRPSHGTSPGSAATSPVNVVAPPTPADCRTRSVARAAPGWRPVRPLTLGHFSPLQRHYCPLRLQGSCRPLRIHPYISMHYVIMKLRVINTAEFK